MARSYDERRAAETERANAQSAVGRDIGGIPPIKDAVRRASCETDFGRFCRTYFPHVFALEWSADHRRVIQQIEEAVLEGGLFATAMPRGSGKTTLAEIASIYAQVYGHRYFVVLIGSDEGAALQMLDSVKTEYEGNELLLADFPEICYPIAALEGISHRCKGQTCEGERTHIGWSADEVILPTIAGSKASGTVIRVRGLTGGLRGMKFKRADGSTVRPDLVIVDDPQTDQSARSVSQCETRERILAGAILGLAGPGRKIAGIMPCTVIRSGDMADRILNRDLHPEWQGTRTKMLYAFPSDLKLWEEYGRLRAEGLKAGRGTVEATEFYRSRRAEMDEGARVAWPERFNPDEVSAVQNAMNLWLQDPRAFAAEYQNEPLEEASARSDDLSADQIAGKLNRMQRGELMTKASHVTAFIDVQGSLLYWAATAWADDFTGSVLDYGAFPEQTLSYFRLQDASPNLETLYPNDGLEGRIYAGLEALTNGLMAREWTRDDGATLRLERLLIDANWGASTDTVYLFARQSAHAALITPSHGHYIGASKSPMREWPTKPGDRVGLNWRMPNVKGRRSVRYCLYDTNWWKSFLMARLAVAMGDRGCLSLFGSRAYDHRMLADHLTAEFSERKSSNGREVDEWKLRPERPDNHLFDCLVGCAVGASIQGVSLEEARVESQATRPKPVSFAELQRLKREQRRK